MDSKKKDLLTVLATIVDGVEDGDLTAAASLLTGDNKVNARRRRRLKKHDSSSLCGHTLQIARGERLRVGGGGVVIPCEEIRRGDDGEPEELDVRYALKVARPSLFQEEKAQAEEGRKAAAEYHKHLPLAHENIAKMYSFDEVFVPFGGGGQTQLRLPCTLIEWVDGALPFDEYVRSHVTSPKEFADLVGQTCHALDHLHRAEMIHWDIKSDNLLVSSSGQVKLMDLGNVRTLQEEGAAYSEDAVAETTDLNLPPGLRACLPKGRSAAGSGNGARVSKNRTPCQLKKGEETWDRPWLDLYMLAREVNRLVGFSSAHLKLDPGTQSSRAETESAASAYRAKVFGGEEGGFIYSFLGRITERLLAASEPAGPFYDSAEAVTGVLDRLLPEYGAGTDVSELQAVPQHVLRIPPLENIPWSPRVAALMDSDTLLRLKKHRQLATVPHVYPGAEHTRWEHTAGAFGRILQSIRALYADRASVLFRLDTTKLDITALMLAALLHDVGHPAFGHQLEESPLITDDRRHEAYAIDLLHRCRDPKPASEDAREIRQILIEQWISNEFELEELLSRTIELLSVASNGATNVQGNQIDEQHRVHRELLRSLLVGPLDADKSDYLCRDAHHCGVEYASGIDRRRLDQSLTALEVKDENDRPMAVLGINRKGVLPLESMLVARYQLFRAVYWHHTVRCLTVMLQELIEGFVCTRGRPGARSYAERLDRLMLEFRSRPDQDAVQWLQREIQGLGGMSARARDDLHRLGEAVLGDRREFFWQVEELYGNPGDEDVYAELRRKWVRVRADSTGLKTLRERRGLRRLLAKAIREKLSSAGVGGVRLGESDLLLDVPVKGRDEVTGLYVSDPHGGEPESVHRMTPMAKAVAEAFERSVRPVRVFMRPSIAEQLCGSITEGELRSIVHIALRETVLDQLEIPGQGGG